MNNNKGFTLAELLAIVVIIGVIAVISTVNMTKQISSSDKEEKNVLSQNIENASKVYAAKYHAKDLIKGTEVNFTLNDLEEEGLLNLKSGQCTDVILRDGTQIIKSEQQIEFTNENPYEEIAKLGNCYVASD